MKNFHTVQMTMTMSPRNQHCMMKKGMGSMMVLGSYLTTIRNSVTVIAATSHACWPSFLWNFLTGRREQIQGYTVQKKMNRDTDLTAEPLQSESKLAFAAVMHRSNEVSSLKYCPVIITDHTLQTAQNYHHI